MLPLLKSFWSWNTDNCVSSQLIILINWAEQFPHSGMCWLDSAMCRYKARLVFGCNIRGTIGKEGDVVKDDLNGFTF